MLQRLAVGSRKMEIQLDSVLYRSKLLLEEIDILKDDEKFNSISCFESNVYIGTNQGQLLHYYRFDDSPSYILLSQQIVRHYPIKKILVLAKLSKVIVLCGDSMNLYSLPELALIQSGKLKEVENIQQFSENELIILTKQKVKIVRFVQDEIKHVKDINETGCIEAILLKSSKSIAIANNRSYDLVNLTNSLKTPLFEYSDGHVIPNIIPFHAKDKGHNEVLLTIESDSNTAMGMFITENGDPERGTLTWIDHGYPTNGIAVVWPYVFGIFLNTLVISSLTALDIKYSMAIEGNLVHLNFPASIQDDNYVINGITKKSITGDLVICSSNSVNLLYEVEPIQIFFEDFKRLLMGEVTDIQLLKLEDPFYMQLCFMYHLFQRNYDKCKEIMNDILFDLLLYLYDGRDENKFYSGTITMARDLKLKLDDSFTDYCFEEIQRTYLENHNLNLQTLAYSHLNSDKDVIEFINNDKDSWKIETSNLTNLIQQFDSQGLYGAKLHLYILLQDHERICLMSIAFLSDKLTTDQHFDFVDLILKSLSKLKDPKIYRDSLLEILRVDSSKGIAYMKKNINGNHKNIHHEVMKEVNNLSHDKDFAKLKLDVLENDWKQNTGDIKDILLHLLEMLKQPTDSDVNNFMVLQNTYLLENTFENLNQVITWVDYLQMNKDATECAAFIEIYLKAYELLNLLNNDQLISSSNEMTSLMEVVDEPIYEYFKICFIEDNQIQGLLQLGDSKSAEYFAVYNKPPFARNPYYKNLRHIQSPQAKSNLLTIYDHYKTNNNFKALKSFIINYNKLYTASEIINMLPQDMSISFIQEYLIDLYINMETTQRKLIMKKIFYRQDSKLNKSLYADLNR